MEKQQYATLGTISLDMTDEHNYVHRHQHGSAQR
jgi:hypothetical protein